MYVQEIFTLRGSELNITESVFVFREEGEKKNSLEWKWKV